MSAQAELAPFQGSTGFNHGVLGQFGEAILGCPHVSSVSNGI